MNVNVFNWDLSRSYKKGQIFSFSWAGMGGGTKGWVKVLENTKSRNLSEKQAKELDTHSGWHFYTKGEAHYL